MSNTPWLNQAEYPFKQHTFEVDGMSMNYIDEGNGSPIVMVHGTPSWSFLYRNLIKELIDSHRCIAPDNLGFGLSEKKDNEDYRPETQAKRLEEFIESLNIPYHTVINCGGDLGQGQVKKYDIELWVPGEKKYREISSASYFHDFQTRRFNIRYRDEEGKLRYAHSLNCTAIPTPRILVSLVENFQQEDGSIKIPPVLIPYFGKESIG